MLYSHAAGLRLFFGMMLIYVGMRFLAASNSEVTNAIIGLVGVAVAWFGYWGLQALGRRYRARPQLAQKIRQASEQVRGEVDYHI